MTDKITITGKDNLGRPRQPFADYLAGLDDEAFVDKTELHIWLSAYARNNHRSDYHWQADACYSEAERRGKPELYKRGYDRVVASTR